MNKRSRRGFIRVVLGSALCAPAADSLAQLSRVPVRPADVDRVEADLNVWTIDQADPDDRFVMVCIREAIAGSREGSEGSAPASFGKTPARLSSEGTTASSPPTSGAISTRRWICWIAMKIGCGS